MLLICQADIVYIITIYTAYGIFSSQLRNVRKANKAKFFCYYRSYSTLRVFGSKV